MIQVYSEKNTNFSRNGDATLIPDEAPLSAELNGSWVLNLHHPIDKKERWKYLTENAVLKVSSFNGDQLFRIYNREKSDGGISVQAYPIFFDAGRDCFLTDVRPTGKNGQQALDIMCAANKKYTAESNITRATTAYYQYTNLINAINGNESNSFVNRWGGEILYDNYKVIINERVGGDYGVELLYGKNIKADGLTEEIDMSDVVTRIYPKAYNGYKMSNNGYVDSPLIGNYPTVKADTITFSDVKMREDAQEDDEKNGVIVCDTQAELDNALIQKCRDQFAAGIDKPKISISADMILLQDTDQYKDYKVLESVSLGDTIHCKHSKLGIVTDARVIALEYDCIQKRVASVELGDFESNYFDRVTSSTDKIESIIAPDGSIMAEKVQGILNGIYTQLKLQSTVAKKVNGRAFTVEDLDPDSPLYGCMTWGTQGLQLAVRRTADGRDWDWTTAITAQGIVANAIIAGILSDKTGRNFWNLDTGEFRLSSDAFKLDGKPLVTEEYVDKMNGNLLKGSSLEVEDIKTYWDVAGKIEHDIEDPSGGVYAIRLTGTVSDNFVSAKYSNNNPINTAGWYEVRVWLKAEKDMSVTISANRVAYKCAVTTKWQQFRIMLPVSAPNTQGFQNFTIGGWGSIPKDAVVYIYRPEISYSYSPDDMLDILTENGKRKGIYSKNGMLYIDGTYIRSGKVSGEYIDARNLTVTNTAGQKTLAVDANGNVDINARSFSISGSAIASEAYADRQGGNLLKGGNLTESDIGQYWETHEGKVTYGQADPLGGKNAIKFYSPVIFGDGSNDETAYLSAKKSTNNPITAPGVYEARFWLKSNVNKTIKISINRTQYDCAVTTSWKQYRYMLDVKTPNTTIYPSFTIGGWNSMGQDETYYIYKPEVIISYSPTDILNLLTNNGAMDGVFIRNGQLYVKGSYIDVDDLKALKATIGGFVIGASGIYKGCTSLTSKTKGVYIGTNGLRFYSSDSNGRESSFTFDTSNASFSIIGSVIKMGASRLSYDDGALTIKYGLHVYATRGGDFGDGSTGEIIFKGLPTTSGGTHLVRESGTAIIAALSSSSKRYKDHIATLKDSEAEKLLDIPVVWFKYKEGYLAKEDRFVDKPLPGFYAEDVFKNFPEAANLNEDGSVEDWNYRTLIPPMLKLIQTMYNDIKQLKENKS